MPFGCPFQTVPKSGWSPVSRPIVPRTACEFAATGSLSTRLFQTFEAGKSGHFGAPGRRGALAAPALAVSVSKAITATRIALIVERLLRRARSTGSHLKPVLTHSYIK